MTANLISVSLDLAFRGGSLDFAQRIASAAGAGADAVEMWGWRGHDAKSIDRALAEHGMRVLTLCPDPELVLTATLDADSIGAFVDTVAIALRWGATALVVKSGTRRAGIPEAVQEQIVAQNLDELARITEATGLMILLEPVESRQTAPGILVDSLAAARRILDQVQHPCVRLLYDVFHIRTMGETPDLFGIPIGHVQVADVPGRGVPGTGTINWPAEFELLENVGYRGAIGLESLPPSSLPAAITELRRMLAGRPFGASPTCRPDHPSSGAAATSSHHKKVKAS